MPAVVRAESLMKIVAPKRRLVSLQSVIDNGQHWVSFDNAVYFMGDGGFYRMDGRTRMLELIHGS